MVKEIPEEKLMETVEKKMKEGWIKSWMMIEVMAVTDETAKKSLENHVNELAKEKRTIVYKKSFKEIKKVESPRPNIPVAYSNVVELEMITQTYEQLVYVVMNYAPSAVEVLEPEKVSIEAGELQGILNSISDMMHKFAAAGVGGVVIKGG